MTGSWSAPRLDPVVQRALEVAASTTHVEEVAAARRRTGDPQTPGRVLDALRGRLDLEGDRSPVAGDVVHSALPGGGMPARLTHSWEQGGPLWVWRRHVVTSAGPPDPDRAVVGIVGTRRPTADGLSVAASMAAELACAGVEVVSGFAKGIDQAAHRGALDAGGVTTAVLGTGLDVRYPAGSDDLRSAVAASGGLVTEHPHGTGVRHPKQFLARNRILAGLCDAVVVIEAGRRSGALNTASWAADMGRDVFAVPCSPSSPQGAGSVGLIRDGATCVRDAADVLDALGLAPAPAPGASAGAGAGRADGVPSTSEHQPPLTADARRVLQLLGAVPAPSSVLAERTALDAARMMAAVGELLSLGVAQRVDGGVVAVRPGG